MINWDFVKERLIKATISSFYWDVWRKFKFDSTQKYENKKLTTLSKKDKMIFYKITKNIWYCDNSISNFDRSYGFGWVLDEQTNEMCDLHGDSTFFSPETKIFSNKFQKKELTFDIQYQLPKEKFIEILNDLIKHYENEIKNYPCVKKEASYMINNYKKALKDMGVDND